MNNLHSGFTPMCDVVINDTKSMVASTIVMNLGMDLNQWEKKENIKHSVKIRTHTHTHMHTYNRMKKL